jgi:aminopeptidase-like protein
MKRLMRQVKSEDIIETVGRKMHSWATDLFPICRSITGPGVRKTLKYIQKLIPELKIYSVPSGKLAFDWIVPDEWTIRDAFIDDSAGTKLVDFKKNNLHIVGYSEPVDLWLTLEELKQHLHSLPDQPDAIPYVTSYYSKNWGFCLTHEQLQSLVPGRYHVVIDAELKPGVLNYGELILQGELDQEIFLSTYICHPSMANNELSGPVVTTALSQWLKTLTDRKYTYRIVFIPETIGSIVYLSQNIKYLKEKVIAGFNITCVGDDLCFSYLPSRNGNTLSDLVALHVLKHTDPDFIRYTWLDRGSDERQYCAPGVDLPIASIMRSKYGEYPEYHTSLDNLELVTPTGLQGGYDALRKAIEIIEKNDHLKSTVLGEPQLGKRGIYPTLSTKDSGKQVRSMMNMLSYCDGNKSLLEIAELIDEPFWGLTTIADQLIENDLLQKLEKKRE